jgi:transposase
LTMAWHVLGEDCAYQELGGDWFDRRQDPEGQRKRLVGQLESLGVKVTIEPIPA